MAECDEMFHRMNKKVTTLLQTIPEEGQKTMDWIYRYREELRSKMKQLQNENHNNVPFLPKTPTYKRLKRPAQSSSSSDDERSTQKENQSTDITDNSLNTTGRSKRNASKLAEKKITAQSQVTLKTKLRKPTIDNNALNDISNDKKLATIKTEKISKSPLKEPTSKDELISEPENIKKENMPPPASKPKKVRKKIKKEIDSSLTESGSGRSTRSKKAVAKSSTSLTRASSRSTRNTKKHKDSDVILQEVPIPLLVIDSDTDDNEKTDKKPQNKTVDSDDEPLAVITNTIKTKKTAPNSKKTVKEVQPKIVIGQEDESLYEDALPSITKEDLPKNIDLKNCTVNLEPLALNNPNKNCLLNTTRIIENTCSTLNETHVLTRDSENKVNCTVVLERSNVTENKKINETTTAISSEKGSWKKAAVLTKDSENKMNCTVVLERSNETENKKINETTIATSSEKGSWKKAVVPISNESLLTEDDSIVEQTPEKKPEPPRKGIKKKQMFSPYANSPVRKRVAAFEKLVNESDEPTRQTRTKTRKDKGNNLKTVELSASKPKTKFVTPASNNKLPSLIPQSDSKLHRLATVSNKNATPGFVKSASAMKPSKAELQTRREEELKKRCEKEEEVKRKRDAIIQAKAEEQRKKREEKQLKAQKLREELEKEKEEKLKQQLLEKEEERQRRLEWQAKKQAEIEERKRAEAEQLKLQKLLEQRQMEEKKKRLLASKPPPLPVDFEDSDSDSESTAPKSTYVRPDWTRGSAMNKTLKAQFHVPKNFITSLYQMTAQTPDLLEIFENLDERLLRRNSSAVWRTPPRYSTLPKF